MHTIHHTEAFVIKSLSAGEANKRVWLFTREFGLIAALAQGVRKSTAKLQAHITDYALIRVDLVRGKEVWRLISATMEHNPLADIVRTARARAYVRTLSAVDRFLSGEDPSPELFDHLVEVLNTLSDETVNTKAFDTLSVWRMLVLLGYVAVEDIEESFFKDPFGEVVQKLDDVTLSRMIVAAQSAIKESQL